MKKYHNNLLIRMKKEGKGITLIALVITIIVLLILAGVTVATLTGDNGLLTKAGEAKNANEKAAENEEIQLAVLKAMSDSRYGRLEKDNLESALGTGTSVEQVGKNFVATLENGKKYRISSNGDVEIYDYELISKTTEIYGKLDDDGTLHLRATNSDGTYRSFSSSNSINNAWNPEISASKTSVTKVIFEEAVVPYSCHEMFKNCSNLIRIENIENLHTENVKNMNAMFLGCSSLESIELKKLNTSSATNFSGMFANCSSLRELDLGWFDTSNVLDMGSMFMACTNIRNLDLTSFDTSSVTDMFGMFASMSSLESIDVSSFDTSSVTNMSSMFGSCSNLEKIDVSRFSIDSCSKIEKMFYKCGSLKSLNLSEFRTNNLTGLLNVFAECTSLQEINLSNIDVTNVTDTRNLFLNCTSLKELDLRNWNTRNVTQYGSMFYKVKATIKVGSDWNSSITASNTGYDTNNGSAWVN